MPHHPCSNGNWPPLPKTFYERDTVRVAKELLGKVLVRRQRGVVLQGLVVEVEAYRGEDDPASHAFGGPTRRNQVMFGEPGHAYVYFTYGMHHCLNVTTEPLGEPGAVLIRAAQPLKGLDRMQAKRETKQLRDLASGPAKLTQAFAVDMSLNDHDLTLGRRLWIAQAAQQPFELMTTARIGIRVGTDKKWRFFVKGSPFVSKC
jgi:DNA-3-methyladenine glycosylase